MCTLALATPGGRQTNGILTVKARRGLNDMRNFRQSSGTRITVMFASHLQGFMSRYINLVQTIENLQEYSDSGVIITYYRPEGTR